MFIVISLISGIAFLVFSRFKNLKRKIIDRFKSEKIKQEMQLLYAKRELNRQIEMYVEKKIKTFLLIVFAGSLLACICSIFAKKNPVINSENIIARDGYEGNDKKLTIFFQTEDMEDKEQLNITVSKMKYSDEEIEKKSEDLIRLLNLKIVGENESIDHVDKNLYLPTEIEGYPFLIKWKSEKPLLISKEGTIDRKRLKTELEKTETENIVVKLSGTLVYEDYEKESDFFVNLFLPPKDKSEIFYEKVSDSIDYENNNSRGEEGLTLPGVIDGKIMNYSTDSKSTPIAIIVLFVLAAFLIFASYDNDLEKKAKERNEQMELDYPKIMNRYALYYCAGMHTKAIWKEICSDYRKNLSKGGERRYVFEEMLRCEASMADGVGEMAAYNEFAANCRVRKYRRFVSLIEQSLQKGMEHMSNDLRKEADEAINERLTVAKIKGEEAGTKLLLPMFLMLLIVLIVVIVPAFISFNI